MLAKRFQVRSLSILGSYVRQQQTVESDVDILVEYHEIPGLIGLLELENNLSDMLGVKVDLVKDTLKPRIAERVLSEIRKVSKLIGEMTFEQFSDDEKTVYAFI